jgi:hypothetical protein
MTIGDEDAAFLLGAGGSTKRKVARAAGARLDLDDDKETRGRHVLTVSGSDAARARAMDYVRWVLRQRLGAIEVTHASKRDDLSVVRVPADCVAYVTGKSGRVLRSVEEEFGTLMFFGKLVGEEPDGADESRNDETLCVLGDRRGRRGAELKVMSAVEHKTPGVFVNDNAKLRERLKQPGDGLGDGFGYDVFPFEEHEFSYARGAQVRVFFCFFFPSLLGSFLGKKGFPRAHFHVDPPSSSLLGVRSPKELIVSADRVTGLRMCSGSRARRNRARESLLVYPHIASKVCLCVGFFLVFVNRRSRRRFSALLFRDVCFFSGTVRNAASDDAVESTRYRPSHASFDVRLCRRSESDPLRPFFLTRGFFVTAGLDAQEARGGVRRASRVRRPRGGDGGHARGAVAVLGLPDLAFKAAKRVEGFRG